jgi:hypothetical protein
VTGLTFGFVFECPFELHVWKAYHNTLITLIISYTGKICAVKRVLTTRGILEFSWIEVFGKYTGILGRLIATQYMEFGPRNLS